MQLFHSDLTVYTTAISIQILYVAMCKNGLTCCSCTLILIFFTGLYYSEKYDKKEIGKQQNLYTSLS